MSAAASTPPGHKSADVQPVRRALISVSDKTGLLEFARALHARGVEILSTGGTAKHLEAAGIPVLQVGAYTGSPGIMDGRVKTLHPRVHGGILMRGEQDLPELTLVGGKPIDLVCVNLYPFEQTVSAGTASESEIVEQIDIGGPSMVRSAAKSHPRVTVVVDPSDYPRVTEELAALDGTTRATRTALAAKAFATTAAYDGAIAAWMSRDGSLGQATGDGFPLYLSMHFEKGYGLRYGENPHQRGAFYRSFGTSRALTAERLRGTLAGAESLGAGGKELSFNNFVDVHAALEAVRDLDPSLPGCIVVKHTNPCGAASAATVEAAYRTARDADALSAFGGIVALNRPVDVATARLITETFVECVVAPSFDEEALGLLRARKNLRLLSVGAAAGGATGSFDLRAIGGGLVTMTPDDTVANEVERARLVTRRAPTEQELSALAFAWRVTKHVKSNAIVLAHATTDGARTVGVGAGQMSRVVSVQIALEKAGSAARGSALGSDAYFPFPDGVEAAARGGVTAIVQPGGSVKDPEVIAAADAHGIAMLMTGVRHFRH